MSAFHRTALLAALALTPVAMAQGNKQYRLDIAWNRLYDDREVVALAQRIQQTWPEFVQLTELGKSSEGRSIWLMVLNNPATGDHRDKPAFYTDANIHGNEVQGTEANLYLAWYLLEHHGKVDRLTALLDRVAFYIIPSVNPDGRAHWFDAANTSSSSRSGKMPIDSDRDGLFDEDPSDDLDGDGHITSMRKRVPLGEGTHREMPDHPGVLERVSGDVQGDWLFLGSEGIDNDGDGRVNEDGPGGYDLNRNWPAGWAPGYVQFGAGDYPLSQPESRCIGEFVVDHPNIAGVQALHNAGGMILRGPGYAGYGDYPRADVAVYDALGEQGEFMLPFYRYMVIHKDLYTVYGGFVTWTYEDLGIFSFTNEMWSRNRMMQSDERLPSEDRRRWDDRLTFGESYVEWHSFEHPLYGDIEIGGSAKMTGRVPPTWLMEEELHRNAAFMLYHAEEMPDPVLQEITVHAAPGGLHYVDAVVRNDRAIPTRSRLAADKKIGLPDRLQISGDDLRVIAGGTATDRFRPEVIDLQEARPAMLLGENGVPSRGAWKVRWIVEGSGEIVVRYTAEKGRDQDRTATLP